MKLAKIAGALPFAHLLGLPSAAAAQAADEDDQKKKDDEARRAEEDKQREGESDDDYAKRMKKAEDDKQREGESDEDYAKRMKKAETDDEDDDGEGADDDSDDAKAARASERARCATIVAHGIKTGAVRQAGVFAFDTSLSAKQAIALLDASGLDGGKRSGLAQRMAGIVVPNVTADGGNVNTDRSSASAVADRIIAAGKKRRNEV